MWLPFKVVGTLLVAAPSRQHRTKTNACFDRLNDGLFQLEALQLEYTLPLALSLHAPFPFPDSTPTSSSSYIAVGIFTALSPFPPCPLPVPWLNDDFKLQELQLLYTSPLALSIHVPFAPLPAPSRCSLPLPFPLPCLSAPETSTLPVPTLLPSAVPILC